MVNDRSQERHQGGAIGRLPLAEILVPNEDIWDFGVSPQPPKQKIGGSPPPTAAGDAVDGRITETVDLPGPP